MPITKCKASKATPDKGINYILNPEKVIAQGNQGFASPTNDPEKLARQMMMTMHLFQKGKEFDERKYYHAKVSFDPKDRPERGGSLTKEKANAYAAKYAAKTWPGREVVWAVQDHGEAIHVHFIVAACERDTGKKLDADNKEYRRWKDGAQELAREMGLSDLDWRKATKEKRAKEREGEFPENLTFAEKGLREQGKAVWKDELRDLIDQAATSCTTMDEFREHLQNNGVTLTRCTQDTISYKYGEHRACRGDTLGADYTAAAIRDALEHNHEPELTRTGSVDDIIAGASGIAAGVNPLTLAERQAARSLGKLAGMPRTEIDAMCDYAPKATWEEKQLAWGNCKTAKDDFWREYNAQRIALQKQISDAYAQRRLIRECEWMLDPRNRRSSLIGMIFAFIYLSRQRNLVDINEHIDCLKHQQQELRTAGARFKDKSSGATEVLRQKGLTKEEYLKKVDELQIWADAIRMQNEEMLTPAELEKARKEAEKQRQAQEAKRLKEIQQQAKPWKPKPDRKKGKSYEIDR